MAIPEFPPIKPNYLRSMTLPDYKILIKDFDGNGEVRRSAQFLGSGTILTLGYELISHIDTSALMQFWAGTRGTWISFTLPPVIINHPNNFKLALFNLENTTLWRFESPFQIKTDYATKQRGLYSFDVVIQSVAS